MFKKKCSELNNKKRKIPDNVLDTPTRMKRLLKVDKDYKGSNENDKNTENNSYGSTLKMR